MNRTKKHSWIKKFDTFKSAKKFDIDYYLSMPPQQRLQTMQFLRGIAFNIRTELRYAKGRKGLQRVIKVVQ